MINELKYHFITNFLTNSLLIERKCRLLIENMSLLMTVTDLNLEMDDEVVCPVSTDYQQTFCGNVNGQYCSYDCGQYVVQFDKDEGG